ncbi:hypothetical protein [Paucidesulfovibrio longus]|uniref:hypothetical protein n=1 Tax=Paucidesulfovibrio longus TaxID=889 RepID=UPI0003B44274|nr:hypothetical protein [Paucidesulfovibrio longus]
MKNLMLVLASSLITLLLLEGVLRIALPLFSTQPDPLQAERHLYSPYRGHELNPLFNTKNNTEGRLLHSPDGFRRDQPIAVCKQDRTIRIFAMGASTLYGLGTWGGVYSNHRDLFNSELPTFHLEQTLNRQLKEEGSSWRVEVINTAVVAYQTFQQLVYLNEKLLDYHPDIIINIEGHNDFYISDPSFEPWNSYAYSSVQLTRAINHRDIFTAVHLLARALAPYSALAAQVEKRVTRPIFERNIARQPVAPIDAPYTDESYRSAARKTFLRAYWQITQLGKLHDFRHLIYLQPEIVLEPAELLTEHDRRILDITVRNMHRPPVEMRHIRDELPELFRSYGLSYFDAAQLTAPDKPGDLYVDYCHLTPLGAERLAENIYPSLLSAIQERIAQREAQGRN